LSLDTFSPSPVNVNGSYEFDKVLKSGYVHKRTRKTKSWKPIYLVLRPTSLSIYKDNQESKLRHKVQLPELTAVAFLKDPKGKKQNVFGLFSPSRNYHLEAQSKADADEWVSLIRKHARIEEEEEEMFLQSPSTGQGAGYPGLDAMMAHRMEQTHIAPQDHDRHGTSSPEPHMPGSIPHAAGAPEQGVLRRPSHFDYSGNEPASHSDMSDNEFFSTSVTRHLGTSQVSIPEEAALDVISPAAVLPRPGFAAGNASQSSVHQLQTINTNTNPLDPSSTAPAAAPQITQPANPSDPERVIWQGHLLHLRSKSGMRQWKPLWGVLRPRTFALYKDTGEYSPVLVIPLGSVINAVEIDPVSKSKTLCWMCITEEKGYRFCMKGEEELDRVLGAWKSLLSRRKGKDVPSGALPAAAR
jgi:hypothetical protein